MLILRNTAGDMRHFRDRNFHGSSHDDDATLWVLVQRVGRREDERARRLHAASQLQEFVKKPENKLTLSRNLESMLNSLIDVFFERSGATLQKEVAIVIAMVGQYLANDSYPFFQWMLHQFQSIANDNVKNYLLESLHKLLEYDIEERKFGKVIGLLMDELQAALENIDSPEHLPVCINPLIIIAQNYQAAFTKHFRDTVDILVGWHIDHTQAMSLTLFASDSLVKLHAHWLTDLQFSLTLLSQFLEDMEAYAEDFHKLQNGEVIEDDSVSSDICLLKMAALMRVFSTVVRSIGPVFYSNNGPPITEGFILEALQRIIVCAQLAGDSSLSVTHAADECARLLLGAVQWRGEDMLSESLLTYAVHAVERSRSEPRLLLVLDFTIVMVQEVGSALPAWFVQGLLGPSSRLLPLKHSRNVRLCSELLALYQACLAVKSVPLLQTSYKHVAGEMEYAINELLKIHAKDPTVKLQVIGDNPFTNGNSQSENSEANVGSSCEEKLIKTATFDITALLEVADAKHSLIGMYALSPSIFELLLSTLKVVHKHLAALTPSLQYALLNVLYSHCQRHKNFLSSFLGGSPASLSDPGGGGFMDNVTMATHTYYPNILELIAKLLIQNTTSEDGRSLLLHWSQEVLERLRTNKDSSVFNIPALSDMVHSLVAVASQKHQAHVKKAAQCLLILIQATSTGPGSSSTFTKNLQSSVTQCCFAQIKSINADVQRIFAALLLSISTDKVLELSFADEINTDESKAYRSQLCQQKHQKTLTVYGQRQSWSGKRMLSTKSCGLGHTSFQAHHFKSLIEKILKPSFIDVAWLERLCWSCERREARSLRSVVGHPRTVEYSLPSMATFDISFLHWWALWNAAEHTVANKLRTSLGRPQDTFQKIEGAIREMSEPKAPVSSNAKAGKVKESTRSFLGLSPSVIQHPHFLLQFFDSLEKLLYNACEGCAVSIPPPSKAVRNFFYTNKKTCEQWLNCLRLAVMKLALSCGQPALTFQHGQMILNDMKAKNNTSGLEFESAVAITTEALIELGSPHSIEGLYRWCRDMSGGKQRAWMKAAKQDACCSFEDAAKEYKQILTTYTKKQAEGDTGNIRDKDSVKKVCNPAKTLISKRLVKCYAELRNWDDLQAWLNLSASDENTPKVESLSTSLDYIKTLRSFDQLELTSSLQKPVNVAADFSPHSNSPLLNGTTMLDQKQLCWSDMVNLCEIQVINSLSMLLDETSVESYSAAAERLDKQVTNVASCCMKLSFSSWPPKLHQDFYVLFATASAVKKALEQKTINFPLLLSDNIVQGDWLVSSASGRLLSTLANVALHKDTKVARSVSNLRIAMAKSNRKHGNYNRAQTLLMSEIRNEVDEKLSTSSDLLQICNDCFKNTTSTPTILTLQYESAKLLQALGRTNDSLLLLSQSISDYLKSGLQSSSTLCSRALLTLVKNLQGDWKTTGPTIKELLNPSHPDTENEVLSKLRLLMNMEKNAPSAFASNTQLVAEVNHEIVIGSLLNLATMQAPSMGKSWFGMAGWCYKWGRKIMDNASTAGSVELTNEEQEEVKQILSPLSVDGEELGNVYSVLRKAHCNTASIQIDDDALDDITAQSGQAHVDLSQVVLEQLNLRCGLWLARAPPQICHALLGVWQRVCARLFAQYRVAAQAYFKFLELNIGDQAALKYEDCNVTATLRLLRLLVKHALELQATLKSGLSTTPTSPWKGIIPQLFSRLNHPEAYVRRSIAELLCRVARQSPHLIVYPVIVATMRSDPRAHSALGASLEEQDDMGDEEDAEYKQDDQLGSSDNSAINSCYNQVLQALMSENEATVKDVQLLVGELRRITLLWDELWLGTLNQHHHDIMRRLQQLQDEAKRVNTNNALTKHEKEAILREQQQAIMRPVVYALRKVQLITSTASETPHECWFAENIQPLINQALEQLQKPSNLHTPQSCWSGFKQVHSLLQNRASKRASHILTLGEISPRLINLKPTAMSMPGVTESSHLVTIEGCSSTVTVLPTKTKPKKLQFIGSDGRRYTYLFKGLEDLHLDERIMQFLSIANRLLRRQHESRGYVARHYSVTPLGPRSGLIQWVSGATPLFLLYKKWQQRQAMIQAHKVAASTASSSGVGPTPTPQILRPSDVYYNKLNPAMKRAGVDMDRTSRKDWPIEVLRSVLEELIKETPGDLLQKELWCSATGAAEFWSMQQKYSQSTAVMSMIGYVIGLGDRHLDNVLIDLETGEVVHIDYNVCFEKGLQLRVPEKVPFRLTQNLHCALGMTGVEGVFRNSCEQVLSTLRKGRETLLTLLEAFVYDPLVDWTGTIEGGYAGAVYGGGGQQAGGKGDEDEKLSKKDMEREITRSLFSSRVAEMKQGWFTNRDEMLKALPALVEKLNEYKQHFKNNVELNENIENFMEVKSQVKSALGDPRHLFNSLPQRWHQHQQQQKKHEATLNSLQDKILASEENMKQYEKLLATLQSPDVATLLAEVTSKLELGPSAYEHALKFLHSAGQANMATQAQSTDKELISIAKQRRHAMQACLDVLSQYAAVVAHFPPEGALACHNVALWRKRLEMMVDGLLQNDCSNARAEVERSRSKDALLAQARAASVKDSALQREAADLNTELVKLIDRRKHEPVGVKRNHEAERVVKTSRDHIVSFVQEHGLDGLQAFTGYLSILLCTLDQSAIAMETTASNAGHRLVDMTSKEGDWFLEELCGLFANIVQLLHLGDGLLNGIVDKDSPPIATRESTRAVICADSVYRTLWELFNNFRNIIVPEAVKLLQCEEPSVVELVTAVGTILQGKRLDELTKQLSGHLRNQGMQNGLTSTHEETINEVLSLQAEYNQLLQDSRQKRSDEQRLTAGQMLLQAFDGLFRSVFTEFNSLLNARSRLYNSGVVPLNWRYIDVLSQPMQLQKFKNLSDATDGLQALLFVKQLQAMHDFFVLCQSNTRAFVVDRMPPGGKGHHYMGSKGLYTEERLATPIKHFISYLVQELVIGIPSEMLGCALCGMVQLMGVDLVSFANSSSPLALNEDLCKAAIDNKYTPNFMAKPTMLIYHFNRAWKEYDRAQRLDANIVAVRASLQRAQLQVTRFQWLHEDLLDTGSNSSMSHRRTIVNDLNKRMATLQQLDSVLHQLQEKGSNFVVSVQQRLKWAAGANPTLQTVLSSVESDAQKRSALLKKESALSLKIIEICERAGAFEQTRLQPRESSSEAEYMKLVESCDAVSKNIASSPVKIDPQERTAVEALPPKPGVSGNEWLQKVSDKIHGSVAKFRHQRQQEESRMLLVKSNLRELVTSVKQLLSSHGRLLSDVKSLLKTMAKEEDTESELGDIDRVGGVRKYMERYKELTYSLNDALKDVLQGCDVSTMLDPDPLIERLMEIAGSVDSVYEDLVAFANPSLEASRNQPTFAAALRSGTSFSAQARNSPNTKRPNVLLQLSSAASELQSTTTPSTPPTGGTDGGEGSGAVATGGSVASKSVSVLPTSGAAPSPKKKVRDPRTGKAIQERNSFALSVWWKVKSKLDGKDQDAGKRMLVTEQVDRVITEATSFDNLALLYEGWTAWV